MNNSVSSDDQCIDKGQCYNLRFDADICALEDVRATCCESCSQFCQDQPSCTKYPLSLDLCDISKEMREKCPMICGLCKSQNGTIRI